MDTTNSVSASRHGVPRVLIVDDELDHAEICAALLRRRGYKVAVAVSGVDAVELAAALKPDIILLDLFMPAVDGFSTAASLHEHPDTTNVPIVFLSACGDGHRAHAHRRARRRRLPAQAVSRRRADRAASSARSRDR